MSYGLLAALSWGVATLMAAVAARRVGALRTVVFGEAAGLAGYWVLFLLGHFSLRGVGGTAWLLVISGVIGVSGYLALYRGLESGHVGLVSAISACYGGVIALLSVLLLHERLTAEAIIGIAATVIGVMLAVTQHDAGPHPADPGALAPTTLAPGTSHEPAALAAASAVRSTPAAKAPGIGVAFGLAAALCYGVGGFMIGRYTRNLGWLVPVVVARGGAMVLLLALLATPLRGPASTRPRSGVAWALAAGLTDAAGLVFFTRGDQVGLVAVTAAVSSAYPVIPLIGGVLLFRERLIRPQIGGTLLILAGLILLGLSSLAAAAVRGAGGVGDDRRERGNHQRDGRDDDGRGQRIPVHDRPGQHEQPDADAHEHEIEPLVATRRLRPVLSVARHDHPPRRTWPRRGLARGRPGGHRSGSTSGPRWECRRRRAVALRPGRRAWPPSAQAAAAPRPAPVPRRSARRPPAAAAASRAWPPAARPAPAA
jgi:drug/metabolite transporter (DMT)-like permease